MELEVNSNSNQKPKRDRRSVVDLKVYIYFSFNLYMVFPFWKHASLAWSLHVFAVFFQSELPIFVQVFELQVLVTRRKTEEKRWQLQEHLRRLSSYNFSYGGFATGFALILYFALITNSNLVSDALKDLVPQCHDTIKVPCRFKCDILSIHCPAKTLAVAKYKYINS